jgi:hypothetical protein
MPNLAEISGLRAELLAAYKRIEALEKELATLHAWEAEKKRYAVSRPTPKRRV